MRFIACLLLLLTGCSEYVCTEQGPDLANPILRQECATGMGGTDPDGQYIGQEIRIFHDTASRMAVQKCIIEYEARMIQRQKDYTKAFHSANSLQRSFMTVEMIAPYLHADDIPLICKTAVDNCVAKNTPRKMICR